MSFVQYCIENNLCVISLVESIIDEKYVYDFTG